MALKRHKSSQDASIHSHEEATVAPIKQSQDEKGSGSTEEFRDDVNVLWDYNSPKAKPKSMERKSGKRKLKLESHIMSPKVPLRRHLSDNDKQLIKQDFYKLREDMRALKEAIAKPDHGTSLVLSPREERFFKIDFEEPPPDDIEDLMDFDPFDDNMDTELLTFSQQILENVDINRTQVKARLEVTEVFNDSFDDAMGNLDSEYLDQLTQVMDIEQSKNVGDNKQSSTNIPSSTVTPHCSPGKNKKICVQSSYSDNTNTSEEKLKEIIEKKRLEALAKLEANKKRLNSNKSPETEIIVSRQENNHVPNVHCDSRSDFSKEKLQEIEKKRLEALAKLEANKKRLDPDKTIEIATLSPEKKLVPNFYSNNNSEFPKDKFREIENKRLEAMAKLEAYKKRLDPEKTRVTTGYVLHCTPEERIGKSVASSNIDNGSEFAKTKLQEIEMKRLEALAKLEANKRRLEPNIVPETTLSLSNYVLHCTPEERIIKSVPSSNIDNNIAKYQEIEKKRLEALSKLEANKKRLEPNKAPETTSSSSNSPLQCTPDEIEKKRLEALAKREAKKQQEIIEKKKLEALKRREESRKMLRPK